MRAADWLRAGRSGLFPLALPVGAGAGLGFFVVIPVIGGLLYGPMIYRWAERRAGTGCPT